MSQVRTGNTNSNEQYEQQYLPILEESKEEARFTYGAFLSEVGEGVFRHIDELAAAREEARKASELMDELLTSEKPEYMPRDLWVHDIFTDFDEQRRKGNDDSGHVYIKYDTLNVRINKPHDISGALERSVGKVVFKLAENLGAGIHNIGNNLYLVEEDRARQGKYLRMYKYTEAGESILFGEKRGIAWDDPFKRASTDDYVEIINDIALAALQEEQTQSV